jgi:hypothetical protein
MWVLPDAGDIDASPIHITMDGDPKWLNLDPLLADLGCRALSNKAGKGLNQQ